MARRPSVLDRAARRLAPIDTTGMDPAMKDTLGRETRRKAAEKLTLAPFAAGAAAFVNKMRGRRPAPAPAPAAAPRRPSDVPALSDAEREATAQRYLDPLIRKK